MQPTLYITNGRQAGMVINLLSSAISAGRSSTNPLQLLDREVSRRHFEVVCDGGRFWLRDLGSNNGTFLNGRRCSYSQLRTGDLIRAGQTELLFTDSNAADYAAESPVSVQLVNESAVQSPATDDLSGFTDSVTASFNTQLGQAGPQFQAKLQADLDFVYLAFQSMEPTLDVQRLIARILDSIFEWVKVDRACVVLKEPNSGELIVSAARIRQASNESRMQISKSILRYVQDRNEGVLTHDARDDERWDDSDSSMDIGIHEAICVPLRGQTGFLGAIYVDTFRKPGDYFSAGSRVLNAEHLKIMIAVGNHTALAIENARFAQELVSRERLAAIGETIASLSHHVKNILQGLNGGTYLLDQGLQHESRPDALRGWQIVRRYQDEIRKLVSDMLSYSRERQPERLEASLDFTVKDCVELMQERAKELKVDLEFLSSNVLEAFEFDPHSLSHAVNNLIHNAIDACQGRPSPKVIVGVGYAPDSGLAMITVQDNGSGIAPTELSKIFDLFHSTKGNQGTGLGLAVSRKIIQEHGGEISVDSRQGSGSKFTITLPCAGSPINSDQPSTRLQPNFRYPRPSDSPEGQAASEDLR